MSNDNFLDAIVFWTEEENFEKVKQFLIKKHGLVPPIQYPETNLSQEEFEWDLANYLIYENPELVNHEMKGVYRVFFSHKGHHDSGTHISFGYFTLDRTGRWIFEQDPMRKVIFEVYDMLKPVKVTDYVCEEVDLEKERRLM